MANIFEPVQRFFNGNFWEIFEEKFKSLGKGSVLDLACGTGELRAHITPLKYLGIDINRAYIKLARNRFRNRNTFFLRKDINKFNLDEKFNTIFFVGSAHHFSDESIKRILGVIKRDRFNKFVLVDGVPKEGPLNKILTLLDDRLGGGKYFRGLSELENLLKKDFRIIKKGIFNARGSFYYYPYLVCGKRQ